MVCLDLLLLRDFVSFSRFSPFGNTTEPLFSKSYIDCLFMAVSALTCTGLVTLNIQQMNIGSQVVIWLLLLLGGSQICSVLPVLIRRYYFKREIERASKFLKNPLEARENSAVKLELNSLTFLCVIVPLYWILVQCGLALFIGISLAAGNTTQIDIRNVSKAWTSIFLATSSYANGGFAPFDDNMVSVGSHNPGLLIVLVIGVLLGNTAYPPTLRLILWLLNLLPTRLKPITTFLLKHPRKCYTHLFPAFPNLFLVLVLLASNLFQFLAAVGLNWNYAFLQPYDNWQRLVNLFFQTVVTRTAGFESLDITQFSAGSQILFLIFMYIAAYPIAVAIRITAMRRKVVRLDEHDHEVGAEHLAHEENVNATLEKEDTNPFATVFSLFVTDIFILCFGLFLICSIESWQWRQSYPLYSADFFGSIYRTIFDTISAYGTVGLSLGYPGTVVSFCASFSTFSKFVMCCFMMLGRMRMLPSDIDPTVRIGLVMTSHEIEKYSRAINKQQQPEPGSSELAEGESPEIPMQPTFRRSLEMSRLREMEAREDQRVRASMDLARQECDKNIVVNRSSRRSSNPSPDVLATHETSVLPQTNAESIGNNANNNNDNQNTPRNFDI
jgi:Trk-type K+ transport system membrane component